MLFTHNLLIFSALLTNLERLHLKLLITAVLQTLSYNNHLTVESFHINSAKYENCLFRLRQFFFYSLISTSQWELPVTLVCSVVSSSAGSYSYWALWSRPVSDQRTVAKRFFSAWRESWLDDKLSIKHVGKKEIIHVLLQICRLHIQDVNAHRIPKVLYWTRPGDCRGHLSTVNSLSNSRNQFEMSCTKQGCYRLFVSKF